MLRTLFDIPGTNFGLPGFGVMLALAVYLATALTAKRFAKLGEDPEVVMRLSMWYLFGGLIGARAFYVIQYRDEFKNIADVFNITKGGMVFYGSAIGAFTATAYFCWRNKTPVWKLLDAMAPSLPLGIAIGRIGCFLNGCCYGDYCTQGPSVQFPYGCDAGSHFHQIGAQSMWGFSVTEDAAGGLRIEWVEPGTDADRNGLKAGDEITAVNNLKRGEKLPEDVGGGFVTAKTLGNALYKLLEKYAPNRPVGPVKLGLERAGITTYVEVRPPPSLPVHPTQLYSTLGAFFLYLYLAAAFDLNRPRGLLIAECFMLYPIGRFIIEELRFDEERLFDGLTISQNMSFGIFALGLGTYIWVRMKSKVPLSEPGASAMEAGSKQ